MKILLQSALLLFVMGWPLAPLAQAQTSNNNVIINNLNKAMLSTNDLSSTDEALKEAYGVNQNIHVYYNTYISTNNYSSRWPKGNYGTPMAHFAGPTIEVDDVSDEIAYLISQEELIVADLLEESLYNLRGKFTGQALNYLEHESLNILTQLKNKPIPENTPVELTLMRMLDFSKDVLPYSGRNPKAIQEWAYQFYTKSFQLALALAPPTNAVALESVLSGELPYSSFPIAKLGYAHSRLMWLASGSLTSQSSKAILLVKMINYLGRDINLDLRRRHPSMVKILKEVVKLQKSLKPGGHFYSKIILPIQSGKEPHRQDVSHFRSSISHQLMEKLQGHLHSAGIDLSHWNQGVIF